MSKDRAASTHQPKRTRTLLDRDRQLYIATRRTSGHPASTAEFEQQERAAHTLRFAAISSKENSDAAAATDIVLARQLQAGLLFDYDLAAACFERKILPDILHTSLALAKFIALVIPWARAAQSITGVRSSLLIAESFHRCILGSCLPASNDFFATRKSFENGRDSFVHRGYAIQSDPKFRGVLLADDRSAYIKELERWSVSADTQDAQEVFMFVSDFELASCDSI